MTDFRMPSLGADMEAGTVVEWLVKPGDTVKRGDVVAVVETQKGAIEIEIFDDGVVAEIVVPVGGRVPVGSVLARLDGEAGAPPPAAAAPTRPVPAAPSPPPPPPRWPRRAGRAVRPRPAGSPPTRGVDLATVAGSGPGGAITLADVEAAAPAAAAPPRRAGFDPAAMRQAIAARHEPRRSARSRTTT